MVYMDINMDVWLHINNCFIVGATSEIADKMYGMHRVRDANFVSARYYHQ